MVADKLHIRGEVIWVKPPGRRQNQVLPVDSLQKKTLKLYNSTIGRDFVLVSSDGTERPVHKVILDISSPVFQRMFESNMEECKTGRCVIEDISTKTLDVMLRYMYYGGVENLGEEALALFEAAEKYEMLDLKKKCEDELVAGINMDNAVDLLFMADKFSSSELKKAALEYLLANYEKGMTSGQIDRIVESGNSSIIKEFLTASMEYQKK